MFLGTIHCKVKKRKSINTENGSLAGYDAAGYVAICCYTKKLDK